MVIEENVKSLYLKCYRELIWLFLRVRSEDKLFFIVLIKKYIYRKFWVIYKYFFDVENVVLDKKIFWLL